MELLIGLLIVAIIIGALMGGRSFGETVRKGCGFIVFMIIALVVLIMLFLFQSGDDETELKEIESTSTFDTGIYEVVENCAIYSKPNVKSDTRGELKLGTEYEVKQSDKYNYFYEITDSNFYQVYVRKECLQRR